MVSRRLAGAILVFGGSALGGEFIVRAFDAAWLAVVGNGPMTFAMVRNIAGILAVLVGLALLVWPLPDKSRREKRLETLVNNMTGLRTKLGSSYERDARLLGEIASVYVSLDKLGVLTPNQVGESKEIDHFDVALTYISAILPMVRDGHLGEAREHAPQIIRPLGVKALRLKPSIIQKAWPFKPSESSAQA